LTRAGLYEELDKAERLLEEHAHCETLFPERAHELEHEIEHLLEHAEWSAELPEDDDPLNALSSHLCELKESQIRSGLHIFGQLPEGEKRIDFLLSLLRMPSVERPCLLQALLGKEPDFDLDTLSIRERDEIEELARNWVNYEQTRHELSVSADVPLTFPENEGIPKLAAGYTKLYCRGLTVVRKKPAVWLWLWRDALSVRDRPAHQREGVLTFCRPGAIFIQSIRV